MFFYDYLPGKALHFTLLRAVLVTEGTLLVPRIFEIIRMLQHESNTNPYVPAATEDAWVAAHRSWDCRTAGSTRAACPLWRGAPSCFPPGKTTSPPGPYHRNLCAFHKQSKEPFQRVVSRPPAVAHSAVLA